MDTQISITDSIGAEFRVGDRVVVNAWGGKVRLIDTGRRATVIGFTASGNVLLDSVDAHDPIANGRAVGPGYLGILRRDGEPGYEGNRPACTCGAREFSGCFCGLSLRDFLNSSGDRTA